MTRPWVVGIPMGIAVITALIGAPATHAEGLTRYWSYWNSAEDGWEYAPQGAGTTIPGNGDVEAWTFVVSQGMNDSVGPPESDPAGAWREACGATQLKAGQKAVAVILDFGTADIAPAGETPPSPRTECAVVEAGANGFQILSAVADVRADGGFLCGIDGYPREECAPIIGALETPGAAPDTEQAITTVPAAPTEQQSGTPWWTLGVLALAAAAAVIIWKRR